MRAAPKLSSLIVASTLLASRASARAETSPRNTVTPGVELSIVPRAGGHGVAFGFGPTLGYAYRFQASAYGASAGAFGYLLLYPGVAIEAGAGARAAWGFAGLDVGKACAANFHDGGTCETATVMPMATFRYAWLGVRIGLGRHAEPPRIVLGAGAPIAF